MGVSEVYADGVLQELSVLSWRVGAVLSLNYGLLLRGRFVSERDDCLVVASENRLHHAHCTGQCVGAAQAPPVRPPDALGRRRH